MTADLQLLRTDPWAHVAPSKDARPSEFFPVGEVEGGTWVPVSCTARDLAIEAAGGLLALTVRGSRTRPGTSVFTEWGTPAAPVVADLVEGRLCWHAVWAPCP